LKIPYFFPVGIILPALGSFILALVRILHPLLTPCQQWLSKESIMDIGRGKEEKEWQT
jgi:hypothetical protein